MATLNILLLVVCKFNKAEKRSNKGKSEKLNSIGVKYKVILDACFFVPPASTVSY